MDIYTVYVDLMEGASTNDYDALKQLMRKEFRISPITPVGQTPVYFSPLFSPLPLIPLKENVERLVKASMKPGHSLVGVIAVE